MNKISSVTKSIFVVLVGFVAIFMAFGTTGCGDDFNRDGYILPTTMEVQVYPGGTTAPLKLNFYLRLGNKNDHFGGKAVTDADPNPTTNLGTGLGQLINFDSSDHGPVDLAFYSNSGVILGVTKGNAEMELLQVNKGVAELVWQSIKGSPPSASTYESKEWTGFMLDLLDCSKYARPGASCSIEHPNAINSVVKLGEHTEFMMQEVGSAHLIWRSK